MTIQRFVGVDGCKAGWFAVVIDADGGFDSSIFEDIGALWNAHRDASAILIDIPIGLNSAGNLTRSCDAAARNALKPLRYSSIFTAPCRETLSATSYEAACRINQSICGKKISQQAWNIAPKIREVDDFLQTTTHARDILRETHPEICFWALNHYRPMKHPKKRGEGLSERLELLQKMYPQSREIYMTALDSYPRKELARDDILDALVNAVTATRLDTFGATLPEVPLKDARGLTMEMVYARVNAYGSE